METLGTKLLAILGAVLLASAAWGAHYVQVTHLRSEITKTEGARDRALASVTALTKVNNDMTAELRRQNDLVAALKLAGDARERAAAVRTAEAKATGQKGQAKAQRTLNVPMSKPGDACGSLDVLLTETIKARK